MRAFIVAIPALIAASVLNAQANPAIPDLTTAAPIAGSWAYAATTDGSEATFTNASAFPQLWLRCTRTTRRISIARPASAAAPLLNIWTSSLTRGVPSSFNPATGRLTAELAADDPLLDAIATSRGRIGFSVGDQPSLVVPSWAEAARVIEDCRA
jgi:hypothetical protein